MDTGLADGIPAFFLNKIAISRDDGSAVADLEIFEPVSENPTFTFETPTGAGALRFAARDTEGNTYTYSVAVPAAHGED